MDAWIEAAAVEQSLHSLRRVRNAFAHSTTEVELADPPYRDRLRESVALAHRNPLWVLMQVILRKHMAEGGSSQVEEDPGLPDFVLLITILVAFLETGARTVSPPRPSLTMTLESGITHGAPVCGWPPGRLECVPSIRNSSRLA